MCGRYALLATPEQLTDHFSLASCEAFAPDANLTPRRPVPVVRQGKDGAHRGVLHRWGLIPSWAKDARIGDRLINARAETVAERPSFRAAYRHGRCLIPASRFYEWQAHPAGKIPHQFDAADAKLLAFAGLAEHWRDPDSGEAVASCCILTTAAGETVRAVHDRMPVILPEDAWGAWLDLATDLRLLTPLLATASDAGLTARPVPDPAVLRVRRPAPAGDRPALGRPAHLRGHRPDQDAGEALQPRGQARPRPRGRVRMGGPRGA